MAARGRAHPHGRALPSFAPRETLVQLRAVVAAFKRVKAVKLELEDVSPRFQAER